MKKLHIIYYICILGIYFSACGNSTINKYNNSFNNTIKSLQNGKVNLHKLTDFEWDKMYTFPAYTSKEEIEQILGFESDIIIDNMFNEGNTYLLFVKDNTIVCNIYGSSDSLGYSINFGMYDKYLCIDYSENCVFSVNNDNDKKNLEYQQNGQKENVTN